MDKDQILGTVSSIVAEICGVEKDAVNENSTVGDFPAWDSVGHLSILSKVEETYDISFEPEEMMEIEDVKDIVEAVYNILQK
ncbi:MAG: acyl carrier protein [Bacteroidales bacterium]|nr:acyl carrier protein [Bacteroidales bacterium]